MEVLGNHVAQLVVPFFLFAPQPVATVAAAIVIATQLWLVFSGNFAWLNVLTIILAFSAVGDTAAHVVAPGLVGAASRSLGTPAWFACRRPCHGRADGGAQLVAAANLFARNQLMNASFNRWRLANAYGAFGSITRRRYEVAIEGTFDADPGSAVWLGVPLPRQAGEPGRLPRQFAPYHLRLDWLMWFLALGSPGLNWFVPLLNKLLDADPATLKLLRGYPFGGTPPEWVRARVFSYRYTTWREWRETGDWWVREPRGLFIPPISRGDAA